MGATTSSRREAHFSSQAAKVHPMPSDQGEEVGRAQRTRGGAGKRKAVSGHDDIVEGELAHGRVDGDHLVGTQNEQSAPTRTKQMLEQIKSSLQTVSYVATAGMLEDRTIQAQSVGPTTLMSTIVKMTDLIKVQVMRAHHPPAFLAFPQLLLSGYF